MPGRIQASSRFCVADEIRIHVRTTMVGWSDIEKRSFLQHTGLSAMTKGEPKFLYLHGFASGPGSAKGVAVCRHFSSLSVEVQRLNLRLPTFEHLRVSEMLRHVARSIGGPRDRAVLFGSSLGGYVASRVASEDARVCALVLLAPAFRLFQRWKERLGETGWRAWSETGWLEVDDHAEKKRSRVDFGFVTDAETLDAEDGGFPDVRVPTLIVHGTRDDIVDIDGSRTFARSMRHVRLVEVDDTHDLLASMPLILRESEAHLASFLGARQHTCEESTSDM